MSKKKQKCGCNFEGFCCTARAPEPCKPYGCTLPKKHKGPHIACGLTSKHHRLAVWDENGIIETKEPLGE